MIVRIKSITPLEDYKLSVIFDDDKNVIYDMKEDIQTLPNYSALQSEVSLWPMVQLDESRTCVFWNEYIDLAADTIYEYGMECKN